MATVCFYFQVHQPYRVRASTAYAPNGGAPSYFDDEANRVICEKVADKCYRPATRAILDLVRRHEGRFRVAFAITGTALDQFEAWTPDLIELFQELAATGACEFIAETSHHSLSFLFSWDEFDAQVAAHRQRLRTLFGADPVIFRNTELAYSDALAAHLAASGEFRAVLCEGVDRLLDGRSPNYLYVPNLDDAATFDLASGPPQAPRLLLKNYRLSDDIAFRFSDRNWSEWPLRAETFASWVNQINGDGYVCNLFMDYETLGEHQWADSGIFEFLDVLPEKIFDVNPGENDFALPSEVVDRVEPVGMYAAPEPISWADTERDLSAWLGNAMQRGAARELYRIEDDVKRAAVAGHPELLEAWRKLTTSDHVYYMCTKHWADGDVHKYFSPYDSPYEAYVHFMNALDDLRSRVERSHSGRSV